LKLGKRIIGTFALSTLFALTACAEAGDYGEREIVDSNFPAPRAADCSVGEFAVEIDARDFVFDFEKVYFTALERDDFAVTSEDGSTARIGPYNYWLWEATLEHFDNFRPTEFQSVTLPGNRVTPDAIDLVLDALCNLEDGSGNLRHLRVAAQNAIGDISDFGGMAINTRNFPYIETGRKVIDSPSPEGLEHYTKYTTGGGIIIVGGDRIPDAALLASRDYVEYMTSATPEWRKIFRDYSTRISLFEGSTSTLPEFPGVDEPGGFAMGLNDAAMTANYEWLCFPGNVDIGGNPVIHELAHTIEHIIFEDQNDSYFFSRIGPMAEAAIDRGIYGNFKQNLPEGEEQNLSHLIGEYWAQTVEGYVMNGGPEFKNSHYSHDWIQENDPELYKLITRYFPTEEFDYVGSYCVN